jgi:hypothetical protein
MKINVMLGKRLPLEEIAAKLNVEKVPTSQLHLFGGIRS